jgi:hypothetical protein
MFGNDCHKSGIYVVYVVSCSVIIKGETLVQVLTFYTEVAKLLSQRIIMSGENARLVEGVKEGAK